jgi:hypothetical protein
MSETPDTDAMVEESFHRINFPTAPVPAEFARRLERERDEWAAMCGRYKQERDEARRQAADAITNYTLMEAKCFRLEHHDQFKS